MKNKVQNLLTLMSQTDSWSVILIHKFDRHGSSLGL